ncbi:hypothetical protein CJ179_34490 [Rhodococcus sp. ACS1]|uniref:Uncharacterized protein n=1 Tax=Rhodococcus jostii TaxID=132919 RepID=A0A1H5LUZ5_RHOJO|nr:MULTISPECIES: hypothetical protein [Rhodococcus]PBC39192.1 hypothetical protein CJ179_34490 [Rhodococcus sp. ACS1]SEE80287.1 hypothetical protein SAMN04490220_8401 [Rhodococcus jostii]
MKDDTTCHALIPHPPKTTIKLKDFSDLGLAVEVARSYLHAAIAQPKDTIVDSWSISYLPSTGAGRRLFTINVGAVEGAHMSTITENGVADGYIMTVYVGGGTLETASGLSLSELMQRFEDDVFFSNATHTKFKRRAVSLSTEVSASNVAFPADLPWQQAAAALADQLLDESKCLYSRYHNARLGSK